MATPDATKVAVLEGAVTGAIYVAPTTVALPTDGTTALAQDYKCLGFTSDDGIVITESTENESKRVWEGRVEVRNVRTEYTEQVQFTPVECNEEVAKLMWGDGAVDVADTTGNLTIRHHGRALAPVHLVIEAVPFEGGVVRYTCKAQLTEKGDMSGNGSDFAGRELTFNCLAVNGTTMTEYVVFTA